MSSRSWKVERRETQFCVKTRTLPLHINLNTSHRIFLS